MLLRLWGVLAGIGGSRLLEVCLSLGEGRSVGEGVLKALLHLKARDPPSEKGGTLPT